MPAVRIVVRNDLHKLRSQRFGEGAGRFLVFLNPIAILFKRDLPASRHHIAPEGIVKARQCVIAGMVGEDGAEFLKRQNGFGRVKRKRAPLRFSVLPVNVKPGAGVPVVQVLFAPAGRAALKQIAEGCPLKIRQLHRTGESDVFLALRPAAAFPGFVVEIMFSLFRVEPVSLIVRRGCGGIVGIIEIRDVFKFHVDSDDFVLGACGGKPLRAHERHYQKQNRKK